jgi:hypothetical protein
MCVGKMQNFEMLHQAVYIFKKSALNNKKNLCTLGFGRRHLDDGRVCTPNNIDR